MPTRRLPRVRPGEILTAAHLNALYEELERLNLRVGNNLTLTQSKTGMSLSATCADQFWARITGPPSIASGGGVGYPWVEEVPVDDGAGGNVDGYATGTATMDPAFESNRNLMVPYGNATSGGAIVWATRIGDTLQFSYRACGSGTS